MEELMLDLMYQLPDEDNAGATYLIDAAAVNGRVRLKDLRADRKENAA
jgi:ATP-dependent protease Clp ATPase subunit